jgi:hypothetical protein
MARRATLPALVGLTACVLISCGLSRYVNAPPKVPQEQAGWWEKTAREVKPHVLATYIAVAEEHRRKGTSATYVDVHYFRTMIGGHATELRLPCPPPDATLARLRDVLKERDTTLPNGWNDRFEATDCVGCTPEEATRLWQEARKAAMSE